MSDFTGRVLGPYKLEQQLGKGGMATVFRAYQTTVKRYVAVKVMSPEIASDPGFVERFTREAELIAALQHPHILPVIDYGQSEGTHYLVMRYIESGSLDDLLRRKQLTFEETSRLLGQIASALDYAHKKGVIHRDFKPNNVLLDADGNAYLTDFGIARLANSERNLTMTGAIMGTPAYMSPEQGMGKTVDARADLYSLGVVLYEMVVGRLPFTGDTPASLIFQHAFQPPAPPQQYRPDVPMAVVAVITRALAKEPDDRYQSGEELVRAFNDAIGKRFSTEPDMIAPSNANESTFVGDAPPRRSAPVTPPPSPATVPPSRVPTSATPPGTYGSTGGPQGPGIAATGAQGGGGYTPPPPATMPQSPLAVPPQAAPARRGPPVVLIVGVVAVLALILGVGGVVMVGNNNTNATNEGLTRVAMIALSATRTPTATPTASDTPTITLTATQTSTPTLTLTPTANLTETAISERLTALAQIEANSTATTAAQIAATFTQQANFASTAIALITRTVERRATETADAATQSAQASQTANAVTTINAAASQTAAAVAATQTQDAQTIADNQATSTIAAANVRATSLASTAAARVAQTATARARPSATPTKLPPKVTPTKMPTEPVNAVLGPYASGSPEDVVARLGRDGILTNTDGLLQVGPLEGDIDPIETPNYYRWRMLGTYVFTNFVASAEFSWKNAGTNGECGLLARYSQPTDKTFRFYVFTVSVANTYRVIAYKDTSDTLVKRGTTTGSQNGDGDVNHILLIGEGSRFRMFLNGVQVSDITLPDFESGTVAIMGSTLSDTGVTCSFKNSWVYELTGNTTTTNNGDLNSNKPDDVVKALESSGTIPVGSATVANQDKSTSLTSKPGDSLVFYRLEVPGSASLKNFILSTDVTWNYKATDTACGVHFFGTRGPSNLMAFSMLPSSDYLLEAYVLEEWKQDPLAKGNDPIIKGDNGATNRVTVVVTGGKGTIFVNGKKLIEQTGLPLNRGNAGYYLSLGKAPDSEGCTFTNTTLWALPQ